MTRKKTFRTSLHARLQNKSRPSYHKDNPLSTPSDTKTFVSGDRVTYRYDTKTYTGTILSVHPSLKGWYRMDVVGYGVCVLPAIHMTLIPTQKDNQMSTSFETVISVIDDEIVKAERNLQNLRDAKSVLVKAEREAS